MYASCDQREHAVIAAAPFAACDPLRRNVSAKRTEVSAAASAEVEGSTEASRAAAPFAACKPLLILADRASRRQRRRSRCRVSLSFLSLGR